MARRGLTVLEEAEARIVFADGILYHRVHIVENAGWTNALPQVHGRFAGDPPPIADNAIALGHHIYFPRQLHTSAESLAANELGDLAWLIHELAHVWQAERIGARYLVQALWNHLNSKGRVYDFGGEPAIVAAIEAGQNLAAFSVEQQAEIAREYCIRRRLGMDTHAWEPLVTAFRAR
jgi:hypothetical protein